MKKQVTLTLDGYSYEQVLPALVRQFIKDNPKATKVFIQKAIGISNPTLAKVMRRAGITMGKEISSRDRAAIDRLQRMGIKITIPTGMKVATGPIEIRTRKTGAVDLTPLQEVGGTIFCPLSFNTTKAYVSKAYGKSGKRFHYEEVDGSVKVTRTI